MAEQLKKGGMAQADAAAAQEAMSKALFSAKGHWLPEREGGGTWIKVTSSNQILNSLNPFTSVSSLIKATSRMSQLSNLHVVNPFIYSINVDPVSTYLCPANEEKELEFLFLKIVKIVLVGVTVVWCVNFELKWVV